jgi:hypothetical protein
MEPSLTSKGITGHYHDKLFDYEKGSRVWFWHSMSCWCISGSQHAMQGEFNMSDGLAGVNIWQFF